MNMTRYFKMPFAAVVTTLIAINANAAPYCPNNGAPTATYMCRSVPTGQILNAPKVFIDYWGWPQGCSVAGCNADTAGIIPILEQTAKTFAADTGFLGGPYGTKWLNTYAQYDGYIYPGNNFGHVTNFLDLQPAPSYFSPHPFFTPTQVGDTQEYNNNWLAARNAERAAAVSYFSSLGYNVGSDAIIVLAFPPGSTGIPGACGSHTATASPANPVIHINYNPQAQCAFSVPGVNNTVLGVSTAFYHELAETLTDPHGGGWLGDPTIKNNETGDLCQNFMGVGGLPIGIQPSTKSVPTTAMIAGISDAAGSTGSCVFARSTEADLFGIGTYPYHLYHQNIYADGSPVHGSWYDWGTLGASAPNYLSGAPASVSWAPYRKDVFVTDGNGQVRHGYTDALNSSCPGPDSPCSDNWGAPAGWTLLANPSVSSWGPGRLDVVVTAWQYRGGGTFAYHVFQRSWDAGSDSGWVDRSTTLGGPLTGGASPISGPAIAAYSPGKADIFVMGSDGMIHHGVYVQGNNSVTWSYWHAAPGTGTIPDSLAVTSWLPGRFDVMATDSSGALWDCGGSTVAWNSCSLWSPPAGISFTNKPSIVHLGDQRLLVASRGSDGQSWMKMWDWGLNTGPWQASGGALAAAGVGLSSW